MTWGNCWTEGAPLVTTIRPEVLSTELHFPLLDRLIKLDYNNVREMLYDKWQQLRTTRLSDTAVSKMIDDLEEEVYCSGAILRNNQRWPGAYTSENADVLRNYVFQRLWFVDGLTKALVNE